MPHHQQHFDETCDPSRGLSVPDIPFDRAEMEKRISLRPTKRVADTANLDRVSNTGYKERSVSESEVPVSVITGGRSLCYGHDGRQIRFICPGKGRRDNGKGRDTHFQSHVLRRTTQTLISLRFASLPFDRARLGSPNVEP